MVTPPVAGSNAWQLFQGVFPEILSKHPLVQLGPLQQFCAQEGPDPQIPGGGRVGSPWNGVFVLSLGSVPSPDPAPWSRMAEEQPPGTGCAGSGMVWHSVRVGMALG